MPANALRAVLDAEASVLKLDGGEDLARAGHPAVSIYRLVAGRLAEVEPSSLDRERVIAVHRPGAVIGAAQILGDRIHHTTLTALRDSELQALPLDRAMALSGQDPAFLAEIARSALTRMGAADPAEQRKGSILGFIAVCDSVAMRDLVERLAAAMRDLGAKVAVLGSDSGDGSPGHLSAMESEHDYVLMAAERHENDFAAFCGRQIDRLILVAGASTPLPDAPMTFAAVAIARRRLLDLILIQPAATRLPTGSDRWLSAAPASRLFQIRQDDSADIARLARTYTGKSVGLALSGGGARAYAHVGVARALRELRVPIDVLAGTSMGAVVAAGLAMGWDDRELDSRIREAFVVSSPLSDIAFPLVAMSRGGRVDARLQIHFGDVQMSDLWRPFTCASTDLTNGRLHVHRRGLVRKAVRASLSLPGVLPPVVEDGLVLVDGALARNLPTDLVREHHDGLTVGVDVAVNQGLMPDDLLLKPSGWRWLTSGAWRKGPPIVAVLIRSATLSDAAASASTMDSRVLSIIPSLDGVGLQDWNAYKPAVEAGYRATMDQAEVLEGLIR